LSSNNFYTVGMSTTTCIIYVGILSENVISITSICTLFYTFPDTFLILILAIFGTWLCLFSYKYFYKFSKVQTRWQAVIYDPITNSSSHTNCTKNAKLVATFETTLYSWPIKDFSIWRRQYCWGPLRSWLIKLFKRNYL